MIHTISTERLVHVLRSIALKQQTGRLSIEQFGELESEKGEIFFVHGETVFTRTGQEVGEAALSRMMNWRVAQYIFFEEVQTPAVISHRNRVVQGPRQTSSLLAVELEQTRYISPIGTPALPIDMEETRQTPAIGVPIISKSIRTVGVPVISSVRTVFSGHCLKPQDKMSSSGWSGESESYFCSSMESGPCGM